MLALRSIVHPTDFSDASAEAFVHALRIALTAKCGLTLLHVATPLDERDWVTFPHVRAVLANWGLMSESAPEAAVADKLGIKIAKVDLSPQSAAAGVLHYLDDHPADLIVLGTQARDGVARLLHGSVAENTRPSRQRRRPCSCRTARAASSIRCAARSISSGC